MAGIFYGWVGIYYGNHAQMVDTWSYHYNGIQEYNLLYQNPHEYLVNLFRDPYEGGVTKFLESSNSYWNDLKANIFIKILSIFNIFSFGHYYTNVIFYSFISMSGPIAIYRVMNDVYPGRKLQVLIAVFLIPSFLYWTSGLHKEGLLLPENKENFNRKHANYSFGISARVNTSQFFNHHPGPRINCLVTCIQVSKKTFGYFCRLLRVLYHFLFFGEIYNSES